MDAKKKIRILFLGSAELACDSLLRLNKSAFCEIIAVITQPAKPKGRSLVCTACPVAKLAETLKLSVITPEKINSEASIEKIIEFKPDLIVVVAYGQILSKRLLSIPPLGCINLHASLLPKYRGAAPIQWAIANGEKTTGVSIMFLNEKMDEGDIIKQQQEPIFEDDTAASLCRRLSVKGAVLLQEVISDMIEGKVQRIPQDNDQASYAPKLKKEDGLLDWHKPAIELERRIRAFNPWPICYTKVPLEKGECMLKIFKAKIEPSPDASRQPGTILECNKGLLIQTGKDALRLIEVQPEGKKRMDCAAFLCGHKVKSGSIIIS